MKEPLPVRDDLLRIILDVELHGLLLRLVALALALFLLLLAGAPLVSLAALLA